MKIFNSLKNFYHSVFKSEIRRLSINQSLSSHLERLINRQISDQIKLCAKRQIQADHDYITTTRFQRAVEDTFRAGGIEHLFFEMRLNIHERKIALAAVMAKEYDLSKFIINQEVDSLTFDPQTRRQAPRQIFLFEGKLNPQGEMIMSLGYRGSGNPHYHRIIAGHRVLALVCLLLPNKSAMVEFIQSIRQVNPSLAEFVIDAILNVDSYGDISIPSPPEGWTALHLAASDNDLKKTQELLRGGADINKRDDNGWTPLHIAASEGFPNMAQLLLRNGAEVNAENHNGSTPLHLLALDSGSIDLARILITHGANVNAQDNRGRKALDNARYANRVLLAQFLQEVMGKNS